MKNAILVSIVAILSIIPSISNSGKEAAVNAIVKDSIFVQQHINSLMATDMCDDEVYELNNLIEYRSQLHSDAESIRNEEDMTINKEIIMVLVALFLILSSKRVFTIRTIAGVVMLTTMAVRADTDTTVVFEGKYRTIYQVVSTATSMSDSELIAQFSDVEMAAYNMVDDKDLYLEFKHSQIVVVADTTRFSVLK